MKRSAALALLVAISLLALPAVSQAKNCGRYKNVTIKTFGGLSCKKAKQVYSQWQNGSSGPPSGWTCGLSARSCRKGDKGFTFS